MAATGTTVDDRMDGDWRITHVKTDTPVRFAGFNLGNFQSVVQEHNGYRIELYANRRLEAALAPKPVPAAMPPAEVPFPHRHAKPPDSATQPPLLVPPDPAGRMEQLTKSLLDTLDFMTEEFGPSPIRSLAITPIPGGFGQGFPGLVYLSTLAYLDPGQLPPALPRTVRANFFFRAPGDP